MGLDLVFVHTKGLCELIIWASPQAVEASDKAAVSTPTELANVSLSNKAAAIKAVVAFVETLMAEDKKSTGLKALQVTFHCKATTTKAQERRIGSTTDLREKGGRPFGDVRKFRATS